jgi:hypothetical protein
MPVLQTDSDLDFLLGDLGEGLGWHWAQMVLPAPILTVGVQIDHHKSLLTEKSESGMFRGGSELE